MGFNVRKGRLFRTAAVACFALLLIPAALRAASFSESTLILQWDTLAITLETTGSLVLTPVDGPEYWSSWCAAVYAENSLGTSLGDWETDVEVSLPDASARAHGWVDLGEGPVLPSEVRELGASVVIDVPQEDGWAHGESDSYFGGHYLVKGQGSATFQVGYIFAWELATSFAGEQAMANAWADLEVGVDALGSSFFEDADRRLIQKRVCDGQTEGPMEIEGVLAVTLDLDSAVSEILWITGEAWSEAEAFGSAVPVPSAILLFGSGLLGLCGLGRCAGRTGARHRVRRID